MNVPQQNGPAHKKSGKMIALISLVLIITTIQHTYNIYIQYDIQLVTNNSTASVTTGHRICARKASQGDN